MSSSLSLNLAHSADADDVFMWWPITGKLNPRPPHHPITEPVLNTRPFVFIGVPEDIQVLNRLAIEEALHDITAISYGAYPRVADRYRITTCGSSMGRGWGPKLVVRQGRDDLTLQGLERGETLGSPPTIIVPGLDTSAFLVLSRLINVSRSRVVVKPFDQIVPAVASGEGDVGLLIHESQLTFQDHGLKALADLGVWFNQRYGLPMPLGANAVRRDLDERLLPGTTDAVVRLLHESIRYALAHRRESLDYARGWSPLKGDAELNRYIDYYVNDLTLDCRPDGARAAELMLGRSIDWLAP